MVWSRAIVFAFVLFRFLLLCHLRTQEINWTYTKPKLTDNFAQCRLYLAARIAILLENIFRTQATVAGTKFGYITFVTCFSTCNTATTELKYSDEMEANKKKNENNFARIVEEYGWSDRTLQLSQHKPLAHSASLFNLHVMASQHGSLSHSSKLPQSHSSSSSMILLPQFRRISSWKKKWKVEKLK